MRNRKTLLITSILVTLSILGLIIMVRGTSLLTGTDLIIFILIIVLAAFAFYSAIKKDKEERQGLAIDDELSNIIKYKSGYLAFMASMYMWLLIFIFKSYFPDIETMLGGGVLLSGLIFFICKIIVKRNLIEE